MNHGTPGANPWPVRVVPISINTVQHPLPSAARCFKLGQAVCRANESWRGDAKVLVVGTGGLSHQLDGARAGFINRDFDLMWMDRLVRDPGVLGQRALATSRGPLQSLGTWLTNSAGLMTRISHGS